MARGTGAGSRRRDERRFRRWLAEASPLLFAYTGGFSSDTEDYFRLRIGRTILADVQADLICVSHLWWDWVWQRPQHLLSRLASHYPVLYVEEPHIEIGPDFNDFLVTERGPNIKTATLMLRSDHDTFWERLRASLDRTVGHPFAVSADVTYASLMFESPEQPRLVQHVQEHAAQWRRPGVPLVLWLYTPVVVGFIDLLQPDLVVFDVMDELSGFKFAPQRLRDQEQELLDRADLVFCGGPSLYAGKKDRHHDAHLFPSGVEQEHFAQALRTDLPLPEDVRDLPRPIIGYFGVVDERMDLDLLAYLAEARPDASFVMVGPTLKIQESSLPRPGNIYYLGKREYAELPAYLKAFDVAMMPFALNESTRFISPTKTLEYMAAHKPTVSTPIPDVISLYGSVVRIADTPEAWVAQLDAALAETAADREARRCTEEDLLQRYAWDTIAAEMHALIQDMLVRKQGAAS